MAGTLTQTPLGGELTALPRLPSLLGEWKGKREDGEGRE